LAKIFLIAQLSTGFTCRTAVKTVSSPVFSSEILKSGTPSPLASSPITFLET